MDATQPTTGFTRVLARPQGVFSQTRPTATDDVAVLPFAEMFSPAVPLHALARLPRQSARRRIGLSPIADPRKFTSDCRSASLGTADPSRNVTSAIPLESGGPSVSEPSVRFPRRTLLSTSHRARLFGSDANGQRAAFFAIPSSARSAIRPQTTASAILVLRGPSPRFNGHARPFSAFELDVTSRTSTRRTRNSQRVLHEKRNARQCFAAGREPHCHY